MLKKNNIYYENIYFSPEELNNNSLNKKPYFLLLSKNIDKNHYMYNMSEFILNNYIINIIYINEYIKNYDIFNIENLIIYYDIKNTNSFIKLINILNKYPPKYHTYIYIYGVILYDSYLNNIKNKLNNYKIINVINNKTNININFDLYTNYKTYTISKPDKFNFIYNKTTLLDFVIYKYIPNSCGANRLIQNSDLCYIAASLNSIILTKKLYNLVKKQLDKNKNNLKNNIQKFFYNNIINNNLKNVNKNDDILLELHNKYYKDIFGFNKYIKLGGDTIFFLYYIYIMIFDKNMCYYNTTNKLRQIIYNLVPKYDETHNIIIYYFEYVNSYIKYNIKYKIINNIKYKLVCSILVLNNTHVVVGYICNKKYYIYDSNNFNIEIDWRYRKNIKYLDYDIDNSYVLTDYLNIYIRK